MTSYGGWRSMLRLPRILRHAWIIKNLHRRPVADVFPILQHPDDLLVRRHFDQLRTLSVLAARREDRVAVGQAGAGLRGGSELIIRRQVGLAVEFPDRFSLGVHFPRQAV